MSRTTQAKATLALLTLMTVAAAVAAEETKVTDLLRSGYEVKAAYLAPGRVSQIHYLVLQKDASVFQCSTYDSGAPLQRYYDYSNTYSCSPVGDLVPQR